jgi:sec-independent protein translocase protein TatA
MFGGLGMGEMILILLVILLFFGAKRIPEIAGSFGKGIKEFKRSVNDVQSSITDPINESLREPPPSRLPVTGTPRDIVRDDETRPEPKRLLS